MTIETIHTGCDSWQGDQLVLGGPLTLKISGYDLNLKNKLTLTGSFDLNAKSFLDEKELIFHAGDMRFTLSDSFQNGVFAALLSKLIIEDGALIVNGWVLHNEYGQIFAQKAVNLGLLEELFNGAGNKKSYPVTAVHYPQYRFFRPPMEASLLLTETLLQPHETFTILLDK